MEDPALDFPTSCTLPLHNAAVWGYGVCFAGPAGMETLLPAPAGALGFTDPMQCVTKPGHGYNGRSAPQCVVGFWNAGGNRDPCSPCQPGYTTTHVANEQKAGTDCKIALGFGYHDGGVVPCPLGEYPILGLRPLQIVR